MSSNAEFMASCYSARGLHKSPGFVKKAIRETHAIFKRKSRVKRRRDVNRLLRQEKFEEINVVEDQRATNLSCGDGHTTGLDLVDFSHAYKKPWFVKDE